MDNQPVGTAPKKKIKTGWILVGSIIVFIIISMIGSGSRAPQTTTSSEPSASTEKLSPFDVACKGFASTTVQTIAFKQLDKNPDSFIGTSATFKGQVLQIQESNGEGFMRLAVDKTSYGWNLSDVILVVYKGSSPAVQDDIVNVSGVLGGTQTYTSQANYQITVPLLYGCITPIVVSHSSS